MSSITFLLEQFARAAKPQHVSGRAARGLFAGRDKRFGNNVSFSQRKTRRSWKVNHHYKALYSEALDEKIPLNVTAHTLRCVDKAGGLDNYLMGITSYEELGIKGSAARERIAEALRMARSKPDEAAIAN
ncbi:39S ribosomal protein L24, mitochondrial [Aphanomyces cochlioides]|nr:39S ribosomal protein L24, mitochondrial [Aphanomyces cochlioides]